MAESILITNSDVQTYRRIDPNFNSDRFDAFAMDVQRKNLRELLGDSLYNDFFSGYPHSSGTDYYKLLNGTDYTYNSNTIHCYGIKPVLVFWWLALATREGDLFTANHGNIQFVNNQQQMYESSKEKDRIAGSYMQTANMYANDLIQYLNENNSLYPLWEGDSEQNSVDFIMFRV